MDHVRLTDRDDEDALARLCPCAFVRDRAPAEATDRWIILRRCVGRHPGRTEDPDRRVGRPVDAAEVRDPVVVSLRIPRDWPVGGPEVYVAADRSDPLERWAAEILPHFLPGD